MYFQYQCIHWYKFVNDKVFCLENVLFCARYCPEYIYIVLVEEWHKSCMRKLTRPIILPDLVFACWKQTQDVLVSYYLYDIDIFQHVTQNNTFTR